MADKNQQLIIGIIAFVAVVLLMKFAQTQATYNHDSESECEDNKIDKANDHPDWTIGDCVEWSQKYKDCLLNDCGGGGASIYDGEWVFFYTRDTSSELDICTFDSIISCDGGGDGCYDSDGGNYPNTPGYVTIDGATYKDKCDSLGMSVQEYICNQDGTFSLRGNDCFDDLGGNCIVSSSTGMAYCDTGSCTPHWNDVCDETDGCGGLRDRDDDGVKGETPETGNGESGDNPTSIAGGFCLDGEPDFSCVAGDKMCILSSGGNEYVICESGGVWSSFTYYCSSNSYCIGEGECSPFEDDKFKVSCAKEGEYYLTWKEVPEEEGGVKTFGDTYLSLVKFLFPSTWLKISMRLGEVVYDAPIDEKYSLAGCCEGLEPNPVTGKDNLYICEKEGSEMDICKYFTWAPTFLGLDSCVVGIGIALILIGFIVRIVGG